MSLAHGMLHVTYFIVHEVSDSAVGCYKKFVGPVSAVGPVGCYKKSVRWLLMCHV